MLFDLLEPLSDFLMWCCILILIYIYNIIFFIIILFIWIKLS